MIITIKGYPGHENRHTDSTRYVNENVSCVAY